MLASIALEFARGHPGAPRSLSGEGWAGAFGSLVARNRRRYGGYIVHAAIVLLAIGVAGSSAYDTIREAELQPGQSMTRRRVHPRLPPARNPRGQERPRAAAPSSTSERDGRSLGTLEAGKNAYRAEGQVSNEVGIRSDWRTGEDLFVIADEIARDGTVVFEVHVSPLVNLIWLAGAVFLLGSLITLWPDAREQRRLAERYAGAPAAA